MSDLPREVSPAAEDEVLGLQRTLLWEFADDLLRDRALGHLAVATAWLSWSLAFGRRGSWAFGLVALLGAVASMLHSRRSFIERVKTAVSLRTARWISWWLPYKDEPHVNPVGFLELVGLILLASATGWPFRSFEHAPVAASPAVVLVLTSLMTFLHNVASHPAAWALDPGPPWMRRIRVLLPFLAGASAFGFLIFASPEPPVRWLVVAGCALVTLAELVEMHRADMLAVRLRRFLTLAAVAVQDIDALTIHSGLKNYSRAVDSIALASIPDGGTKTQIQDLLLRISATVDEVRNGRTHGLRTARDVVEALERFRFSGMSFPVEVTSDLVGEDLGGRDAILATSLISDLVTNALNADASIVLVALEAQPAAYGSDLTVEVRCACRHGLDVSAIGPASSLYHWRRRLREIRGTLRFATHGDGSHSCIAQWPSRSSPRRQTPTEEPASGTHG